MIGNTCNTFLNSQPFLFLAPQKQNPLPFNSRQLFFFFLLDLSVKEQQDPVSSGGLLFAAFIYLLIYLFPLNIKGVGKPSDGSEGARHRELLFACATAGTPRLQPALSPLPRIMRSLSYCSLIIPAERTSE